MSKEKKDGLRVRRKNEGDSAAEDGLHSEERTVDAPDEGADTGHGGGVESLPSHPRNTANGGAGPSSQVAGETQWEDLRPITNPTILAKKQEIDDLEQKLKSEVAMLRGMLLIDAGVPQVNVDLDRMVYQVEKTDLA